MIIRGRDGNYYQLTPEGVRPVVRPEAPSLAEIVAKKALDEGVDKGISSLAGSSLFSSGSGLASSAAENAAWNAAADAATAGATPTAGVGLGALANAGIAVAGPLIAGKLVDKAFFKDRPDRKFNAEEVATDIPNSQRQFLAKQIPGYDKLSKEERMPLLSKLHEAKLLAIPGVADAEGNTKERHPESLTWRSELAGPRHSLAWKKQMMDRNSKWFAPTSTPVPSEEDITNAHWLKDSRKNELLGALSLIKNVGAQTPDITPVKRPT